MYQQYGISKETFGGAYEAWSNCRAPEDPEQANADVEAALRGEREFLSEFRVHWPDGSIHTIKGMAHTIRSEDGRPLRMVGIDFDITEQKRAAEEIMKLNAELEQRVVERTAQLEAANKELEAFNWKPFLIRHRTTSRRRYAALMATASFLKRPQPRNWMKGRTCFCTISGRVLHKCRS